VQAVQAIAPNAPDVANMAASRLQTSILHASLKDPDSAKDYQDLINSLRELRSSLQEDGKKKDGTNDLLGWMKNLAIMQTAVNVGSSVAGNAMQGNIGAAAGGAVGAGIGGLLGMLGGPAGMMTGLGVGASIGSGIGGMVDRLVRGADQSLAYETQIADINQRFGVGNVGRLRNFELGTQNGFRVEETAGLIDQLRENRALSNPAMAGPLVNTIQELTRALGLNVEATANMAGIYSRTGGEKGAEGVRGYLSDVVGGAIRAGFESNIQQYADMMGSARMQAVQQTGQGMSDRAFGLLQDVMAGLTGGNSRTSALFRDNVQMAGAGLQSFLSYGGTADPYSTSAAYLRLAGVDEAALDSRFNSPEQMMANAQRVLRMTTNRVQGISGMGADEFRAAAASDPNFVQNLIAGNSGLQRQTSATLQGILGRQATAQDLRTFEELANISAANGGRLPTGPGGDGGRVEQLLAQLQESPGDQARKLEAEAHNLTIQAMSNLNEASLKMKETQVELLEQLNGFPLKEIGDGIAAAMDNVIKFIREAGPQLANLTREGIAAFHKLRDMVNGFKESAIGKLIFGGDTNSREIGEQVGSAISSPVGRSAALSFAAGLPGPIGSIATAANIVRTIEENPEAISVENAQQGAEYIRRHGPFGEPARRIIPRALRSATNYIGGLIDGAFNDTPGSVTAGPGYNVFAFAPGDIVSARMGGTSGGASLTDIFQVLRESNLMDIQAYQTASEQRKLLQDVTNDILKTDLLIHVNSEINTQRQLPSIIQMMQAFFPQLISAVDSVREALVSTLNSVMGGAGGGGGGASGAIASGLFTGPSQFIGGSSSNHIDSRYKTTLSWEEIDGYFMQKAQAYNEQGRRIEFSNAAVAGQVYDPSAPQAERIRLLQRAAAAHAHREGWHAFDYYIPMDGDARSEAPGTSSAGAEIYIPSVSGGRVAYGTQQHGFGHYASIYDERGNLISQTGHGDNRRPLPQGRTFPSQPAAAGGGGGTASAADFIKQFEGFHPTPYWDHQQYSWGYGTRAPGAHGSITREQAEAELQRHLAGVNRTIDELVTVPLNENQRTALQSFIYNVGGGEDGFAGSTLLRRLNRGDYAGAANEFRRWNKADGEVLPGLTRRRQMEADLFRRPVNLRASAGDPSRELVASMGRGNQTNNRTTNITVNIASATDPARTRQEVTNAIHAARPYLDEFEQTRQGSRDRNPRNSGNLSPVYG
jgi:GH24 family phage-related lysozyme (muramidase)